MKEDLKETGKWIKNHKCKVISALGSVLVINEIFPEVGIAVCIGGLIGDIVGKIKSHKKDKKYE